MRRTRTAGGPLTERPSRRVENGRRPAIATKYGRSGEPEPLKTVVGLRGAGESGDPLHLVQAALRAAAPAPTAPREVSPFAAAAARRRARSRAKLCPHLFDVPICLSCLRRRSTTWSLTAQSSRARTVRWREFRAKLFSRAPQASAGGESRCRQSRRSRAQPPFPGEGAMANSWGQLPSITAEMRHRASSHCTR